MSHAPIPREPVPNRENPDEPFVPIKDPGEPVGFFGKKKNVRRIIIGLYVVSGLLALIDLLPYKHSHFAIEDSFAFYGLYGFVGCVTLVLLAKLLRKFVMRSEDYYER